MFRSRRCRCVRHRFLVASSRQTQSSPADAQVQQPQPVRGPDRPEAAGQAEQDREGRRAEQGAVRADQPGARARQEHRRGQKEGGGVDRAREAAPGGAGQARGGGPHRGRTGRTEAHRGGAAGGGGTARRGAPPGRGSPTGGGSETGGLELKNYVLQEPVPVKSD